MNKNESCQESGKSIDKKKSNIGRWHVGEQTDTNAKFDFIDADLREMGVVRFTSTRTSAWSRKMFNGKFIWNGQTIHATLFIDGKKEEYVMNFTKVSGKQKTIATRYNRNISTAEANNVILLGWDVFLDGISKS